MPGSWSERIVGQASKIFALLAAITQLLGTIKVTAPTSLGFWGSFEIISGNLNLGAAMLAMFDRCCEQDGGRGSGPGLSGNGYIILFLFVMAGGLSASAAAILFGNDSTSLPLACGISLTAFLLEGFATFRILKASHDASAMAPMLGENGLRPGYA